MLKYIGQAVIKIVVKVSCPAVLIHHRLQDAVITQSEIQPQQFEDTEV